MGKQMNENNIEAYIHCGKCLDELEKIKPQISPKNYLRIEGGFTKKGLQIWCNRHDCNIIHIDFEGQKHPSDSTLENNKNESK